MSTRGVAVSAPGKVLFAGGFLVLDRQHTGLVFGLNARIHIHVKPFVDEKETSISDHHILVESPQFRDARWLYQLSAATVSADQPETKNLEITQITDLEGYTKSSNKFVETTLKYTLTYLAHCSADIHQSIRVTILADDDYYSQSKTSTRKHHTSKFNFSDFGVSLSEAHKTGLGSSAALTTALVGALLAYLMPSRFVDSDSRMPLKHVHNLAQAAHCAAQGKVGSGFDVAAAVYGSCLYRRFTPTILESVGESDAAGFGERLHLCVEDLNIDYKWDVEVANRAVEIPGELLLVMCDVDCGSETPGMVRNILKWRKENADEAMLLWAALQQGTEDLCRELKRLSSLEGLPTKGSQNLGDIILTIRSLVREMSLKSNVPVEPSVITELLNHCTALPGVVGGVAPGAGGYDAVALLVHNDEAAMRDLQTQLEGWKSEDMSGATIGNVRLLGVQQDKEGVRIEDPEDYSDWI